MQNSIYKIKFVFVFVISVLGLGGVVFDSVWGGGNTPPRQKKHCLK